MGVIYTSRVTPCPLNPGFMMRLDECISGAVSEAASPRPPTRACGRLNQARASAGAPYVYVCPSSPGGAASEVDE